MKHLKKLIILSIFMLTSCGSGDLSVSLSDSSSSNEEVSSSISTHTCDYNDPTYTWADDNSKVTATRVCKEDATHIETETVSTTCVTVNATCTEDGSKTYTSGVFTNGAFEVQTKVVTIDKLGHDYEISYSWATDHLSVTATATCKNDDSHIVTETVTTTGEVVEPSTCTTKGSKTYTSNDFENSLFAKQTYVEELDYASHTYGYASIDDDSHTLTCSVCGHETTEAHHYDLIENVWATRINHENYIGHRTYKCSDCEHEYIEYHWDFEFEF